MRILVVDDDPATLSSLKLLLESRGHQVACFHNPKLTGLVIENSPVDVLILDYSFPTSNGVDILRSLREQLAGKCRVVLISGHAELLAGVDLKGAGVDVFLPKPFDLESILAAISNGAGAEEIA